MPRISGMDMLKAVVTDINTVEEAHRPFYVEKNGKFVLNVTPADGFELDNVQGLKTALGAERNNVAVLREQLKPYEGLDATSARTALERIAAFGEITPDAAKSAIETAQRLSALDPAKEAEKIANEKLETAKAQLAAQFGVEKAELSTKITSYEQTIQGLTGQLQGLMREGAIKAEVAKANPLDDARDAIELLAGQFVRTKVADGKYVVEVIDGNGNPRMKDYLNNVPFTVADLLSEIRESKPALFKPDDKRGIGVQPNSGGTPPSNHGVKENPWAKETRNLTQQMVLIKTKPEVAKQLAAQAGVDLVI
ncbi:hypothetical protein [Bradyrhizobium sp. SZCCHNRI2010]|uniref:hypothetical protein n=1 Tax=Bradyrhizobium sp. SZCCHNRI2010 TaxID=3057283 RepID=UPI0028E6515E|nr:hypothetical protein [Bradyrhizobium sp. SZCCHNRI2010]